ncbi:MAG: hypothetical protein JNM71_02415 [Flavobacterium lindanitolerans]|jgi:hypothetical protein|uniref:hypothetical protein n=1 Tax=Flavobacterium TaxID=237 RepID=UPI0006FC7729|nr:MULTISPECIES: hypothetical protein [Flavobacterium]KQS50096.1 hypothetical protein ASG38_03710 [Flavobacterium sp. Leaf359]MBL7866853.1 hypothetical protein [Flavobacterium lindanitolerans]PZQ84170.1 MAG: hypothetical protein DI548_10015 [Flavobacterium johnsoniae]
MKKIILISALFFMISCKSQKSTHNNNCDVSETENLKAFDSLYTNLDTTQVFKNKLKEFGNNKTGVLFCQFPANMKHGKFTEIKAINDKLIYYNSNENQILLNDSEIEVLSSGIRSINKKYYYEQCGEYISDDTFYLMLIKRDGNIVAKYFTDGKLSFKKTERNLNLNTLKDILEIMYRNSFKN